LRIYVPPCPDARFPWALKMGHAVPNPKTKPSKTYKRAGEDAKKKGTENPRRTFTGDSLRRDGTQATDQGVADGGFWGEEGERTPKEKNADGDKCVRGGARKANGTTVSTQTEGLTPRGDHLLKWLCWGVLEDEGGANEKTGGLQLAKQGKAGTLKSRGGITKCQQGKLKREDCEGVEKGRPTKGVWGGNPNPKKKTVLTMTQWTL